MTPSDDAGLPEADRMPRGHRGDAIMPLALILVGGAVLFLTGLLIGLLNLYSPAVSWSSATVQSWEKVGFLLAALGLFTLIAIPGALLALGHPWVAGIFQSQEPRFKHPRFLGLTQAWAGTLFSGWLIAVFVSPHYSLARDTYVAFLVGFGPIVAMLLADRR